ncbi:MAG: tetratricopeptide repeat protein [Acidobacteriota bacterium]
MRWFVSLTAALVLVLAATAAKALTQEEILKRRLDKMSTVDSTLRTEEQQRQDQLRESTTGVGSGPSKRVEDTIAIPDPVRQPHPEPKSGLFNTKGGATTPQAKSPAVASPPPATTQPAMQPAPKPALSQPVATPMAPAPVQSAGRDPKAAASLAAMAAKAQASGDNQTALTMLDEAIAADPADPDLRNNRGNILSNLGKPKDALSDYDRAITAKATDPAFFTNRGLAHERLGNRERACTDYKKACDLGDCDFFKSYKAEGNCR